MVSQSRRPRSSPRTERAPPKPSDGTAPKSSPGRAGPAPTPTAALAHQIQALVRRIADLEAKNTRVEAEHAADAEQLGRLLAAAAEAQARVRMLEARADRERQRGPDTQARLLSAALASLRDTLSAAKGDRWVDDLDDLLRATLTALELTHEHSDAIEQAAEITKTSALQQGEGIVSRAFAAVATRAHATQIEIERVDALLAEIAEQARTVKKLGASLDDARASLVQGTVSLVAAVRALRAVTGSLATGAPPAPPRKRSSRSRIPRK